MRVDVNRPSEALFCRERAREQHETLIGAVQRPPTNARLSLHISPFFSGRSSGHSDFSEAGM